MKVATDSFIHYTLQIAMMKQQDGPGIMTRIGKAFTKLLYLEIGIYLVLGVVALLMYGVKWLVELF